MHGEHFTLLPHQLLAVNIDDRRCMQSLFKLALVVVVSFTCNIEKSGNAGDPTKVCYNSKLRRCCPGETTSCVSKTTLRVANQVVEVEIHSNSSGTCILRV